MTSADKEAALAALTSLEAKMRRPAPREERLQQLAAQLQYMAEFSRAAAEQAMPGWQAKFERLHAEFCVLLGGG